ncbi:sensor domain-containing diguanylate cyclase [Sphaerotilus mobilis]|uniref:diguanylate cyclase n=1 Tax=Sphaerotilus mobilis TaxID=47994 RepID=A0A4Q7LUP5_9BURK|nr:diguanylate cyclase [Sphaerotilus mobilis]RZS58594.1 diguanylate cyclase (GGDEF)-like protein [Sphaerotilus mobilis]
MNPLPEPGDAALLELLYAVPVGLVQFDEDGRIALINSMAAQLLLPLSDGARLDNFYALLDGLLPSLRAQALTRQSPDGMVCDGLRIEIEADPPRRPQSQILTLAIKKISQGRLVATLKDISAQVRRERQLQRNEAWSHAIHPGTRGRALGGIDERGVVVDWDGEPTTGKGLGHGRDTVIGRPLALLYADGAITEERVLDRLREADLNGWSLDEGWLQRDDGSRYWGSVLLVPLRLHGADAEADADPVPGGDPAPVARYTLVIRDISDQRASLEAHRRESACDHLTGIANRRTFFDAAELELLRWRRAPRPLSLLMIDADRFKRINDRHGHAAGDAVLRHLAVLLSLTFRQVDVAARIGGEEFAVLLPSTALGPALGVAERLRQAVADAEVAVDGLPLRYTVSIGVATMDDTIEDIGDLLKRADKALYAAKAAGRNLVMGPL